MAPGPRSLSENGLKVLLAIIKNDEWYPRWAVTNRLTSILKLPTRQIIASTNLSKGHLATRICTDLYRQWAKKGFIERNETHIRIIDREAAQNWLDQKPTLDKMLASEGISHGTRSL